MPATSCRRPSTWAAQLAQVAALDARRELLVRGAVPQRGDRHDLIGAPGAVRELAGNRGDARRRVRASAGIQPVAEPAARTRLRGGRRRVWTSWSSSIARSLAETAPYVPRRSTMKSMASVNVRTSSGSIAGNRAIRSWFRPSLRYGSTSTMPLARSARRDRGRVDRCRRSRSWRSRGCGRPGR